MAPRLYSPLAKLKSATVLHIILHIRPAWASNEVKILGHKRKVDLLSIWPVAELSIAARWVATQPLRNQYQLGQLHNRKASQIYIKQIKQILQSLVFFKVILK